MKLGNLGNQIVLISPKAFSQIKFVGYEEALKTKDVKNITRAEAIEVYYQDYWKASGADNIDNPVGSLILFDTNKIFLLTFKLYHIAHL